LTGLDPVGIYAVARNVAHENLQWPIERSRWDDLGLCIVKYEGGLVLRFETGVVGRSLSPIWSLGSGIGEWTEYGFILGTRGQVLFDLLPWDASENGRLAVWRVDEAVREHVGWSYIEQPEPNRRIGSPAGASAAMFDGQLNAFIDSIEGRESDVADAKAGTVAVALVEAAYESSRSGHEVRLPAPQEIPK
jgi:predicted dehydrogenase